jgi:hypothetical protein
LQGFAGRAATTTLHDATETGVSISGIFQAAEDFAVLGWWYAYELLQPPPVEAPAEERSLRLKLEFDIEYDQTLDGTMRFDAAKFPSISRDAMTFVTGSGDIHEVRLLDQATVVSGSRTAATVLIEISGDENMDGGIDWVHLYFRDTRYTVTSTDCRVETQLTTDVNGGNASLPVQNTAGTLGNSGSDSLTNIENSSALAARGKTEGICFRRKGKAALRKLCVRHAIRANIVTTSNGSDTNANHQLLQRI